MIGFTSVSLRSYSIEDVIDAAIKSKADFIEWGSDRHIKNAEDALLAKKLCFENGIIINSYATYFKTGFTDISQWREICSVADMLGAKSIRVWLGKKGSAKTEESEFLRLVEETRKMSDVASDYGLDICYECHPNTFNDTENSSLRFLKTVDRDNVKTYYQSWYRDEQSDKSKLFNTYPYVRDIHISFSELEKFQRFHKKDKKYIAKILTWLKELDFNGALILEFTEKNKAENLINDIFRLREMWYSTN